MKKIGLFTLIVALLNGCNGLPKGTIANPQGKVMVNEEQYVMMPLELEWSEDNVEINRLGSSDINELADQFTTLEVEKGESLKFDLDQNPLITGIKWNEDGSNEIVEMEDDQLTMPTKEGYYLYEVKATWKQGKESFILMLM